MHKAKFISFFEYRQQFAIILLWLIGFLFGVFLAAEGDTFSHLLLVACNSRISIISLLLHCLAPFLISVLSICWNKPWVILAVCFIKALLLGACIRWLVGCFQQASWIVLPLLLFSDLAFMPAIIHFWLNNIKPAKISIHKIYPYILFLTGIIFIDYCYISLFLVSIFNKL